MSSTDASKLLPIAQHLPINSPITLGCMWFGGAWDAKEVTAEANAQMQAALDTAIAEGINFIDHADIYGLGKAEAVFGNMLKERPSLRDELIIQTKCGIRFKDDKHVGRYDFSYEWITSSVENSLSRLNTDHIDVLLLHRPDPLMEPEVVAEAFNQLAASGKVKHFGVSNMHRHQIEFLQAHLAQPLIANQVEVNLNRLDFIDEGVTAGDPQGLTTNFNSGTIEHCRQHGIQIQSWGSLGMGLFTGKPLGDDIPENIKATAALVSRIASDHQCSKEAVVLAWLLRHPANIQPVIGTTNSERIKACAQASKVKLSREEWYDLYVTSRGQPLP